MKSMCKHWGLHISTNINCLGAVLGSFWAVWRELLWCLKVKLRSWQFLRYWWFNKWYHGGYQLICLISRPLLIASRRDWYRSKGLFKGFPYPLRPWEPMENWWRYGQMKFVTPCQYFAIFHRWRENQFHNDLSLQCTAKLVWSRTTTGRPWLYTILALYLVAFCGWTLGPFWTLRPSR